MGYWKYQDEFNNSPSIAAYVFGSTISFSATYVNDTEDTLLAAYLYVATEFAELVSVRLTGTETYYPVSVLDDPLLLIDKIAPGEEIDFDFQFANAKYESPGFLAVPINIAWNNDDQGTVSQFFMVFYDANSNIFWAECAETNIFWTESIDFNSDEVCGLLEDLTGYGFTDSEDAKQFTDAINATQFGE